MGRFLGVDYGRARIGISHSDERKILSSPFSVFKNHKKKHVTLAEIEQKTQKLRPIELIVVGLPLLLSGEEGEMAKEAKAFGELLSSYLKVPCLFWDERLSSSQAERLMKEGALSRKERASHSDTFAATLILQNYLDFCEKTALKNLTGGAPDNFKKLD